MSGESERHQEEAHGRSVPTGATKGGQERSRNDRVGPYGGDDGALEHERAEIDPTETLSPDDVGSRSKTGRKSGR